MTGPATPDPVRATSGGGATAASPPPTVVRVLGVAVLVAGYVLALVMVGQIATAMVDPAVYATAEEYDRALNQTWMTAMLIVLACDLAFFAWLAPRVSYRWFDAFGILVPLWSVLFSLKLLWRLTALSSRPWEPGGDTARRPGPRAAAQLGSRG